MFTITVQATKCGAITEHAHTKSLVILQTLRKYQNSESKSSEDQIHMSLKVFPNNKSSTERLL